VGTETIEQRQVHRIDGGKGIGAAAVGHKQKQSGTVTTSQGRWPANLIHDGSEEVVGLFPITSSGTGAIRKTAPGQFGLGGDGKANVEYGDTGSAARFFYCAKASKKDRDEGLEDAPDAVLARSCQAIAEAKRGNTVETEGGAFNKARVVKNHHPTVKPTDLMRYLCRLVTPPEGIVLDPFMGSGSTGKAAVLEGFEFIGIEREAEYLQIAKARIEREPAQKQLL
jgi:site-specific DNA-methyltransferase (adenine-specific)